jgi:tetratricopeptide (TPR) repeat protein
MNRNPQKWIAAALLLAASFVYAQEGRGNGRLTGTITDESGVALANATITLKYNAFNRTLQTKSNAKGQWGFLGLGKGEIQVSAELAGFSLTTMQMPISGATVNPEIHIILKSDTSTAGDANRDAFVRANELFDQQKYAEALTLYQEFAGKNPDMFKIGIYIGNCKTELREYDEALAEFQKVLDIAGKGGVDLKGDTTAAQAYAGIGDIFLRQQKFKEAEENFRRSIDILPSDPALPFNVAEIMFAQSKTAEAEKYYLMATQIKPSWPKPYLKLAYVALNQGQMDKSLEYLNKFCEIGKDDPKFAEAQALLDALKKK